MHLATMKDLPQVRPLDEHNRELVRGAAIV
jgi:hypothetical protein